MTGRGAACQMQTVADLLTGHAVLAGQAGDQGEPGHRQLVRDQARRRAAILQAGTPSLRKRASHLRLVRVVTVNELATAATLYPPRARGAPSRLDQTAYGHSCGRSSGSVSGSW